jgi:hypothetical protein
MINLNKIVLFTSLLIATIAAGFSIYGIGLLFSGAAIAAMVMATTLELGKLVTTTWLFQNWKRAPVLIKSYMIFAVVTLMMITSLGIFGYLTAAYQKSALENELRLTKIGTYETQQVESKINIETFGDEIDKLYVLRSNQEARMTDTLNNALITRNPIQLQTIQGQINSQIEDINTQLVVISGKVELARTSISELDESIIALKIEGSEQKDITTFKFVADEFGTGMNDVAKWFILVIIAVFDPLAVILLIAANMSLGNIGAPTPIVEPKRKEQDDMTPEQNASYNTKERALMGKQMVESMNKVRTDAIKNAHEVLDDVMKHNPVDATVDPEMNADDLILADDPALTAGKGIAILLPDENTNVEETPTTEALPNDALKRKDGSRGMFSF